MSVLLCPVCKQPLASDENQKRWCCENNHSFDRARQGYLNLLLSHKKKSKNPGDSQEMVIARQEFLNSDFYRPISDTLNQLVVEKLFQLPEGQKYLLDIGCGEGYYTQRLQDSLNDHLIDHTLYGLDISKDAVLAAAKRSKAQALVQEKSSDESSSKIEWLVASGIDMPIQANSIDIATCLFTRLMPESYQQVLKKDGLLICVTTGEEHLIELRRYLYDEIKPTYFKPENTLAEHFELISRQPVKYQNTLENQQQIQNLLLMTPHQWRTRADNREAVKALESLTVTVDAQISIFKTL
jgi:23S rRNA (guanine745-N1)-methyltransferase